MQVTIHHEDETHDVKINSLIDEDSGFHPRVKCFPLYTLMLAVNHTSIDLLSLGCQGQELQVSQQYKVLKQKVIPLLCSNFHGSD